MFAQLLYMKTHKLNRACLQLVAGLVICTGVAAAPVAPADAADVPDQSATAAMSRATERSGAAESAGTSRSVELLIELQSKTAGLDFSERARENGTATKPGLAPGGPAAPAVAGVGAANNAAGLFGSGAVPMPVAKETTSRESDWRGSAHSNSSGSATQDSSRGDTAGGGGRLTLPREIIQWVRDNRGTVVIGALAVLLVLWGTSIAFSQRRH